MLSSASDHLRVGWVKVARPWDVEEGLVRAMRPPMNREHNADHPFYEQMGEARKRFRSGARAEG